MNKYWVVSISLCLTVFLLSFVFILFGVKNRLDTKVQSSTFLEVRGIVETVFYPKHDFVNVVIIVFKNPNLQSTGKYWFSILDKNGQQLRRMEFSGRNIGDPSDLRFQFDPLEKIAGEKLTIRIEPEGQLESNLVSVAATQEGDVAFASYRRQPDTKSRARDILGNWKKRVQDDIAFFGVWFIVLGITVFLSRKKE